MKEQAKSKAGEDDKSLWKLQRSSRTEIRNTPERKLDEQLEIVRAKKEGKQVLIIQQRNQIQKRETI